MLKQKNRKTDSRSHFEIGKLKLAKSKRSIELLGEHTVETVMAVLGIIILIGLGVLIYSLFRGSNRELAQAEATLNAIKNNINANFKNIGDSGTITILIESPKGWYIMAQPGPALCICEDHTSESCEKKDEGKCIIFEKGVSLSEDYIEIELGMNINAVLGADGTVKISKA